MMKINLSLIGLIIAVSICSNAQNETKVESAIDPIASPGGASTADPVKEPAPALEPFSTQSNDPILGLPDYEKMEINTDFKNNKNNQSNNSNNSNNSDNSDNSDKGESRSGNQTEIKFEPNANINAETKTDIKVDNNVETQEDSIYKSEPEDQGYVELHHGISPGAPYKLRREDIGIVVGINQIKYTPTNYTSIIDGATYQDVFHGDSVPITQFEAGVKYNHPFGSLSLTGVYGTGFVDGSLNDLDRTLDIKKYGIELTYVVDNIFDEPVIAPYFAGSAFRYDVLEDSQTETVQQDTDIIFGMRIGILIQLDWFDRATSREARFSSGLQNSFIDLFVAKNGESTHPDDPSFATDFDMGVGIKLEF